MSETRLSLALEAGLFTLPPGPIAVFGATAQHDLTALPAAQMTVVTTFKPDHDALAARGLTVALHPKATTALAVVFLPRARAEAQAMLAEAGRISSGPVIVDGQKTDGIEGILRALRKRSDVSETLSKHHGKLAVIAPGADLSDWSVTTLRDIGGFVTVPGVFSADGPDPGSALLADALPASLGARVADLGAGWGFLSRAILARDDVNEAHLIEADARALDCARTNLTDPRARFHWADATTFTDSGGFDAVVMNPPFHTGRAGDPGLGKAFIAAAARLLKPRGQLWLVANRHLPYEGALGQRFSDVLDMGGTPAFKIYRASRPRKRGDRP